jgi:2-alkyl-3-oxoalkanoate reductase
MRRIAILGAGGFIGNRAVEMLHLGGVAEVVPVVRRASGLALPCRFDLPVQVADGFDEKALARAFAGCEAVLVALAGDRRTIVGTLAPIYHAAEQAGVRRIVYLSTASVHGQAPAPGTDETSPLSRRQPLAYNAAKIEAERRLLRLRRSGTVEVVLLRPGIVHGPRSQWIGGLADELLSRQACLVDGGLGICNAVYVDNVVHAIRLALDVPAADGEAFLIGDGEELRWRDFYRPVAEAFGIDIDRLPQGIEPRPASFVTGLRRSRPVQRALRRLPKPLREGLRAAWRANRPSATSAIPAAPEISLEQSLLHRCSYKLPWEKARRMLGYEPPVSFEEGCRRSIAWLAFAGYPVISAEDVSDAA